MGWNWSPLESLVWIGSAIHWSNPDHTHQDLLALSMVVGRIYTLVGTDAAMRAVSDYLLTSGYQGRYGDILLPHVLVLGIAGRPILAWQLGWVYHRL